MKIYGKVAEIHEQYRKIRSVAFGPISTIHTTPNHYNNNRNNHRGNFRGNSNNRRGRSNNTGNRSNNRNHQNESNRRNHNNNSINHQHRNRDNANNSSHRRDTPTTLTTLTPTDGDLEDTAKYPATFDDIGQLEPNENNATMHNKPLTFLKDSGASKITVNSLHGTYDFNPQATNL
ncbi:hypothetical protein C6P42_001579 [Pichia californica]|nr:hypothetical protein C6P42_001579 [[Candida] californica]